MDFLAARTDPESLARYVGLMRACFPGVGKFSLAYLRWLYLDNPDGPVIGFDAFDGDQLAAHYACIPATALLEGAPVRVMLSLNTATHPRHQGKGLFTQLAERTYDAGRSAGMAAAYGVANANSTPGFTRKLGFQLVAPLEARVGVGSLGPSVQATGFERTRSADALAWRSASPVSPVRWRLENGVAQCFARAGPCISACDEFDAARLAGVQPSAERASPLRLFLGLRPQGRIARAYVAIPQRLRPSPLNLIYKPLASPVATIDRGSVRFSFLDFDAY